ISLIQKYQIKMNKSSLYFQNYSRKKTNKINSSLFTYSKVTRINVDDRDTTRKFYKRERSEEHTSELQSRFDLVCRLLLEKKKTKARATTTRTTTIPTRTWTTPTSNTRTATSRTTTSSNPRYNAANPAASPWAVRRTPRPA